MIYAINLIFSIACTYSFSRYYPSYNKNKFFTYFLFLFPMWVIWLIICGGQDAVGTDYTTYYSIFKTQDVTLYYKKLEFKFAYVVEICGFLELDPQTPFYFFYFIGALFFIKILTKLQHESIFIFIILYICISTVFNNQLNGLRQYIALYLCTYALMVLPEAKGVQKFLIYIILAAFIHSSSFLLLPLVILRFYPNITFKGALILLIFSIIFGALGGYSIIIAHLSFLIPTHYQHYIGGTFDIGYGISKTITKLIFIPFYFYSLYLLKDKKLDCYNLYLYKIGLIGYSIRVMFLNNLIFNRIGNTFLLISMLPLYFLLRDLYINQKYIKFILITTFFITFYLSKVLLFPTQEYLYKSIYLTNV